MRLWVKHSERRPQPAPAETNDTVAFFIGMGGWLVGLAVVVGMLSAPVEFDPVRVLATIAVGLALGIAGLLVSRRQRRRQREAEASARPALGPNDN